MKGSNAGKNGAALYQPGETDALQHYENRTLAALAAIRALL